MKIDTLAARIETIAPLTMQEPWDHSGWQLRLTDGEIHSVLIALEINEQVIDEAIGRGAELILTHHPLLFTPIAESYHEADAASDQRLCHAYAVR